MSAIEAHMYGLFALPIFKRRASRTAVLLCLFCVLSIANAFVAPAPAIPAGAVGAGTPIDAMFYNKQAGLVARDVRQVLQTAAKDAAYTQITRKTVDAVAAASTLVPIVRTVVGAATIGAAVYSFLNDAGLIAQNGQIGVATTLPNTPVAIYRSNGTLSDYYSTYLEAAKADVSSITSCTLTSAGAIMINGFLGITATCYYPQNGTSMPRYYTFRFQNANAPVVTTVTPITDADLASKLAISSALPSIVRELDPDGVKLPWSPSVMVLPDPIVFPPTIMKNADGTTTTTTRTLKPYYNPDGSVAFKEETSAVTTDPLGNVISSSTTTKDANEKPVDFCDSHPHSIGCADLDTPDGDIPKANKNISYQPEQIFGGGSCPSDKFARLGGQQIKVWDWQQACGYVVLARPVLIAAASFMALMIVIGAKVEL